ncbi:MAG: hypothetical protein GX267_14120 [Fibrobacter sp.]|jgi:hypothetical protein|nr:hypothetical protein [Fibrobacter sp.]
MTGHIILAVVTLFVIFILFLVISRTINNMINLLIKIQYLLEKELELKKEALEVRLILMENNKSQKELKVQ